MNAALRPDFARTHAFLGQKHRLLINNEWVEPRAGGRIEVLNPATGKVLGHAAAGDAEDIDLAVRAARNAFENGPWPSMPPLARAKLLWKLADLIEQAADEIGEVLSLDNGMPFGMAKFAGALGTANGLRYTAGWSGKVHGEVPELSEPGKLAYTLHEPVGVVGCITPWNFPFAMEADKAAAVIASGCTMVLKPAELTPFGALLLGRLVLEAGIPPGVVNIVTGYGDPADMARAIPGAAMAVFANSGQICVAGSRLYIHKKVFDQVVAGISGMAQSLKVGPGLEPDTQLGPLVSQGQMDRVTGYIEGGRGEGAEVVTGGRRQGTEGYFIQPTVLAQTHRSMKVVREEIFGPVICAMPIDDDDLDRIARVANDTTYGLSAYIWTRDVGIVHKLARKIRAGTVQVNGGTGLDPAVPFGGYKRSGWGREHGRAGVESMMETKAIGITL